MFAGRCVMVRCGGTNGVRGAGGGASIFFRRRWRIGVRLRKMSCALSARMERCDTGLPWYGSANVAMWQRRSAGS